MSMYRTVQCPNCQLSNEEGASTCRYCRARLKQRSWWGRFLAPFGGEKTVRPSAPDPTALKSRGNEYLNRGQFKRAIKCYDDAIRVDPHYADAYYNRGKAFFVLREYDRAMESYNEAIRLKPGDADAYNNRGYVHLSLNDVQRAAEDFGEAIGLNPQAAGNSYAGRVQAYIFLGKDEEAQQDYDRAVDLGIDPVSLREVIEQQKMQRQHFGQFTDQHAENDDATK